MYGKNDDFVDIIIDEKALAEIANIYATSAYMKVAHKHYQGEIDEGKIRIMATLESLREYMSDRLIRPNFQVRIATRENQPRTKGSEL